MTMKLAVTFGWVAIGALAAAGCGDPAISSTPNPSGSASASVVDTGSPADPSDDDHASTPAAVSYADVAPILDAHCTRCHGSPTSGGAPFALDSYGAAASKGNRIVSRAVDGDPSPMPPTGLELSDHEAETIVAWVEAGTPE